MIVLLYWGIMINIMPINLIKEEEFYLRDFSQLMDKVEEVYSSYFFLPYFTISSKNHIITTFRRQNIIYYYDAEYNLVRSFGGTGYGPSKLLGRCLSLTLSQGDKIAITDSKGRITVFNDEGEFLWSFLIPRYGTAPIISRVYQNFLIVLSRKSDYPERKTYYCIQIYDYKTGELYKEFFVSPMNIVNSAQEKKVKCLFLPYFTISKEGHIICNYSIRPEIYEYDLQGNLIHTYKEVPPHYIKLEKEEKEEVCKSSWVKDMLDINFSYSGWPSLYGRDMFVIQRGTYSPIYLDFYSIKDKKYLGFCKTDKPFLFSDLKYIYLCENLSDTLFTIGKYRVVIGSSTTKKEIPTASSESRLAKRTSKKKIKKIPFKEFKIKDLNGKEIKLLSLLPKGKHHFIFFTSVRECLFYSIYGEVKKFCSKMENFDFSVVINHPYIEEAKLYYKGIDLDVPVIMNTEPERIKELRWEAFPFLLVVDKNGNIRDTFNPYKEKTIKSLLEFLERVEKRLSE